MSEISIGGTLIWYYYICPRQVWFMGRKITPDEDNELLDLGRVIHAQSKKPGVREMVLGGSKIDLITREDGELLVYEIKKSSKFKEASKMQLLYYLLEFKRRGVEIAGELSYPEEKKREKVRLTPEDEAKLVAAEKDILRIIYQETPPPYQKTPFCKKCAYLEFCVA
ncbi:MULTISPECIES: CRISPR-associated protein Cas4 [Carboxydothermus]|uniref:CRISPR-associated exonuclease Cas4 n=1 Tax=Carboxydothermus hydrogenoformans (strain ATCC BAA-161 / DSM 6008 / Z-2901) TaxID=246194 RepID=Q3AA67_CARHZ|nr:MULTISPECIES: CRISPR-associated protein Cas4 [Carboxydothermus]ABB14082.1 CRISPR-associated protein Cas4 [Carboxydothermus hydrogenoformans Z-2901]